MRRAVFRSLALLPGLLFLWGLLLGNRAPLSIRKAVAYWSITILFLGYGLFGEGRATAWFEEFIGLSTGSAIAAEHNIPPRVPIDLGDLDAVRAVKPLLIAHRGGVVTAKSPECSLAAIRLAAQAGYHMVELDVRPTKDDYPVVFHDRDLAKATGQAGTVGDFSLEAITAIRYRNVDETIAPLEKALATCRALGLGVMLDIKEADSPRMLKRVADLVRQQGLERSTITLNSDPRIAGPLAEVSLVSVKSRDAVPRPGRPGRPLQGYFWFGLPKDLPLDDLPRLQREGALILPAINTFRYPAAEHETLAQADIRRLQKLGVDGFQIDSAYQQHFELPKVP